MIYIYIYHRYAHSVTSTEVAWCRTWLLEFFNHFKTCIILSSVVELSIKEISWSQNFSKSHESINFWQTLIVECDVCDTSMAETHSFCLYTDVRCVSLQAEASCGVEGHSDEECVRRDRGNLRARLHQGGQQGWRRHLGGAAPLQTGVGLKQQLEQVCKNSLEGS